MACVQSKLDAVAESLEGVAMVIEDSTSRARNDLVVTARGGYTSEVSDARFCRNDRRMQQQNT